MSKNYCRLLLAACFVLAIAQSHADADEGMWLFNDLPKQHLKEAHGIDVTDEWADS